MLFLFFFFQAEDGIRDYKVTGVQTCALPISERALTSIATAVLFAGLLSGCASKGGSLGMTVPRGTDGSAGYEIGGASPADPPRAGRLGAIIHTPSAFDCQAERANAGVFEQQRESSTSSN